MTEAAIVNFKRVRPGGVLTVVPGFQDILHAMASADGQIFA
jgi:hypothetical protein